MEQTSLGQVFMCTHGGSRYGNDGCRRTYLSQRDLQAHINHRHLRLPPEKEPQKISTVPLSGSRGSQHMPVLHSRSNLVSVPIQDPASGLSSNSGSANYYNSIAPPTSAGYSYSYSSQTGHYTNSSYYANYQQPAPPPPPPPPPQQQHQYDGNQSYANQWSSTTNQSFYR